MKSLRVFVLLAICCINSVAAAGTTKRLLQGTWCSGTDGLVLTFFASDSLRVGSTSDESVQGNGVYKRTDTTFTAVVKNGDITMDLKYRYRWIASDTVSAQAIHFTVNGDSVQTPAEWMSMIRCAAKK